MEMWGTSWTTMLIALDIVGILLCVTFVVILYRKRRKAAAGLSPQANDTRAQTTPIKAARGNGFNQMFENVLQYPVAHIEAKDDRLRQMDPYEEARWLAEMGMSIQGIAERVDLPRCEIELMIDLCRIRSSHNVKGRKLAEAV